MTKTVLRVLGSCAAVALLLGTGIESVRTDAAPLAYGPAQGPAPRSAPPVPDTQPLAAFRPVLNQYCIGCHNDRLRTGGLALDKVPLESLGDSAPVWEKVVQKLRTGAMPPPGRPRPERAVYESFATSLETALDRAAAEKPNPGRPAVHRLNRTEYTNAIRDLLALDIDGRAMLPVDDSAYGFDNNADLLTVSPGLLERYMSAALKISRLAIGGLSNRPVAETYQVPELLAQDDRVSEDLPFGTRGGLAIRHHFPADGEYVLRVRLKRDKAGTGAIRGLAAGPQQIAVHLGGERIKLFTVGDSSVAAAPKAAAVSPGDADAGLEVRFTARGGASVVGVSILNQLVQAEGVAPTRLPVWTFSVNSDRIGIDTVQIEGPYNAAGPGETPSRRLLLSCSPARPDAEEPCAKEILTTLARRAYRRPVADADVAKLMRFYRTGRALGSFDAGLQSALENILIDPEFLFRIERDPVSAKPGDAYRLTDVELASRLSFFLWSSIPDDELLDLGARDRLHDAVVLQQQVGRMLADSRSSALVSNFGTEWLQLRKLRGVTPDVNAFPEFDDNLRAAFQRETELFLESQLRDDRSVGELLTANYTFLNERLARHYGIANIYGSRFRRVELKDGARLGLLGQGSILTVTSHATRTSPVLRGKWMLENLLGAPPPPPPPNVPALPDRSDDGRPSSVRERLEEHRKNPVCASCHASMDPLGFALENFDAIGKWRDVEAGAAVDTSGTLPDGTKFKGPGQLRTLLVARRDEFVMTATDKLLTYALGRGLEPYDRPALRRIVRSAAAEDYHWSSIILGVVNSQPFQMRRAEP